MGVGMRQNDRFETCADPIFIIGSPRSGTSILAWSLAQHAELWTSGESDFLFNLFGAGQAQEAHKSAHGRNQSWLTLQKVEVEEFLRYLGLGLNALYTQRSRGRRWVEQTPRYTLMAPTLAHLFPGAKFVHILRDGPRVVNSMLNFSGRFGIEDRQRAQSLQWVHDFPHACKTWALYVEEALRFEASSPDRCLTVVNEELLREPAAGFRRILDFLDLHYDDAVPKFFGSNKINSSFGEKRDAPVGPADFGSPWDQWTKRQRSIFERVAGQTMDRVGLTSPSA